MARPQMKFTQSQKEEIRIALKNSKNTWEQKRLMILNIRAERSSKTVEIAEMLRCSNSNVTHVIANYFRNGIEAVKWNKKQGNRRNLTLEEEKALLEPFLEQAEKGQMLIIAEIQTAYEAKVERTVPKSTIYRMLARQGWRKIMPRSKHPKAKPEEREAYKKN
jgi:transposase